jgi:hypothetical protein
MGGLSRGAVGCSLVPSVFGLAGPDLTGWVSGDDAPPVCVNWPIESKGGVALAYRPGPGLSILTPAVQEGREHGVGASQGFTGGLGHRY